MSGPITTTVPEVTQQPFTIGDTTAYHNFMMDLQENMQAVSAAINLLSGEYNALNTALNLLGAGVQTDVEYVDQQVADFDATIVNSKLAEAEAIPGDNQLLINTRYLLTESASVTMPSSGLSNGTFVVVLPDGDLVSNPAVMTFGHPVRLSGGSTLPTGDHNYNRCSAIVFVYINNTWVMYG